MKCNKELCSCVVGLPLLIWLKDWICCLVKNWCAARLIWWMPLWRGSVCVRMMDLWKISVVGSTSSAVHFMWQLGQQGAEHLASARDEPGKIILMGWLLIWSFERDIVREISVYIHCAKICENIGAVRSSVMWHIVKFDSWSLWRSELWKSKKFDSFGEKKASHTRIKLLAVFYWLTCSPAGGRHIRLSSLSLVCCSYELESSSLCNNNFALPNNVHFTCDTR